MLRNENQSFSDILGFSTFEDLDIRKYIDQSIKAMEKRITKKIEVSQELLLNAIRTNSANGPSANATGTKTMNDCTAQSKTS
ncbi:hypothetical protein G6F56_014116 [Rhizopus delemar]|nr:hypothetical protein G6F56_014116 [Rhizopus delemar]